MKKDKDRVCSKSLKVLYICQWYTISQLQGIACHTGSRSVTCHPTQANTSCINPSHAGWHSIYLTRRDGRLSWSSWLDSTATGSRTSDLSITSPTPSHCTTKTTSATNCTKSYHSCELQVSQIFSLRRCLVVCRDLSAWDCRGSDWRLTNLVSSRPAQYGTAQVHFSHIHIYPQNNLTTHKEIPQTCGTAKKAFIFSNSSSF